MTGYTFLFRRFSVHEALVKPRNANENIHLRIENHVISGKATMIGCLFRRISACLFLLWLEVHTRKRVLQKFY